MIINGVKIKKGSSKVFDIPVASLPSGTKIDLFAHVYRSKNPGPTLLVIGGIHGDEINGVEIVRRSVKSEMFKNLQAGAVIAIPLLNVYGFINFSREFPGGKDVNRSFPGTQSGSLASRIAKVLTDVILPHVDYGLDFHTGGASIYNYPQSRVYRNDPESLKLASLFSMPYTVKTGLIAKSLRKIAHSKEIPMVVFEGGESLRIDEFSIEEGMKGIGRVLYGLGMSKKKMASKKGVTFEKGSWIRASRSGIFRCLKSSGEKVKKGDVLGEITDPNNNFVSRVKSRYDGTIYGHNNNPVINQGDALFHIGY
ncbi:MAG: succinylglutamate desuccinylase/aspartoacylase family protein [Flavobacteriales bacterium]|nr:succinylglutamate desuccinylase/aspartoacylase family protein [Flavobacteriales bacterium]